MNKNLNIVEVRIPFDKIEEESYLRKKISKKVRKKEGEFHYRIVRKSIDARKEIPFFLLRIEIAKEAFEPTDHSDKIEAIAQVESGKTVIIVGAGPAGYFAALECLRHGMTPIVMDRGKDVRARRRDLKAIQQLGEVNPHSNYCFGEGGAGTYSDGKLYTRSHKRGKIQDVLELLVAHGAKEDILLDAHPHIGSNKLPIIVGNIRQTIEDKGGQVIFNCHIVDFIISNGKMTGVVDSEGAGHYADAFVIATGHSARDIYKLYHKKDIKIEAKPFALGVRLEHPQALIDEIQYNQKPRSEHLPAASYRLNTQVSNKGVFSFCMCPGGLIVPAATAPGELVVNGMSLSRRDSPFANSGVVVEVSMDDLKEHGYEGVFAAMEFQKDVETKVFDNGIGTQKAPAQRLTDFLKKRMSNDLPDTSYIPGIYSAQISEVLPDWIVRKLRFGIEHFERNMRGYLTNEAIVVATESRTSSPVKVPRDRESYMHPDVEALYPCGEGAGYAGGILSAAMDGQNVARAIKSNFDK